MDITVIIPVHGDGQSAKIVCQNFILNFKEIQQIIIVAEEKKDDVFNLNFTNNLGEKIMILLNELDRGVRGSILTGLRYANSDTILVYPADELLPIFSCQYLFTTLNTGAEFVSATRYAKGGRRLGIGNWYGNLLSRVVSIFTRILTKGKISDITTGIKAFQRQDWMSEGKFVSSGWAFLMELELHFISRGGHLYEFPILSVDRFNGGVSKFKPFSWTIEYLKVIMINYQALFKR